MVAAARQAGQNLGVPAARTAMRRQPRLALRHTARTAA
jgi:hypothetical protein